MADAVCQVAGRAIWLRDGPLALPLLRWLGSAARPGRPPGQVTIVEAGDPGRPPQDASLLHTGPVEMTGSHAIRWLGAPEGRPSVRVDLQHSRVVAVPAPGPTGWAPAALGLLCALREQGLEPLHAAAVAIGDGAAIVLGSTGAGKSTCVARFAAEGLEALADDALVLDGDVVRGLGAGVTVRTTIPAAPRGSRHGPAAGKVVLPVPRGAPRPARATIVLAAPRPGEPTPRLEPIAPTRVHAALLESALFALDPRSAAATRARLRSLSALPGYVLHPGAIDAPLLPAVDAILDAAA